MKCIFWKRLFIPVRAFKMHFTISCTPNTRIDTVLNKWCVCKMEMSLNRFSRHAVQVPRSLTSVIPIAALVSAPIPTPVLVHLLTIVHKQQFYREFYFQGTYYIKYPAGIQNKITYVSCRYLPSL